MKRLNENIRVKAARKFYQDMLRSFYWLEVLVKQGLITKAEAGYIMYTERG